MKEEATLAYAVELGVDYLGFVIDYPKSPRSVSMSDYLKKVAWLKKNLPGKYMVVAVTVNMHADDLESIINEKLTDVIQLHGNESVVLCRQLNNRIETWKAISQKEKLDSSQISEIGGAVSKILLDSGTADEKAIGGSGNFDNIELYNTLRKRAVDVVLSGGINAQNILQYIQKYDPSVIDVSGGIESSPGVKDRHKMKEFVETMRGPSAIKSEYHHSKRADQ